MKQGGLFTHLQLDDKAKKKNNELIKQANTKGRSRQRITVSSMNKERNQLAVKVQAATKKAQQYLDAIRQLRPEVPSELVTDTGRLDQYMKNVKANGIVFIDTEGSGLDPISDFTCGLCLWTPNETRAYIPYKHTDFEGKIRTDIPQIPMDYMKGVYQQLVNWSKDGTVKAVFGNAKYDCRIIKNTFDMDDYIRPFWDVIFAGSFLNENEPHGLKYLWTKYCNNGNEGNAKYTNIFGGMGFNWFDPEKVYEYAAFDSVMTGEVYYFQEPFLNGVSPECVSQQLVDTSELYRLEMDLMYYLCEIEDYGVKIDEPYANEVITRYKKELNLVTKKLTEIIKDYNLDSLNPEQRGKLTDPVNIGSPAQLAIIFYDILEMKHGSRKHKKYATGEAVVSILKEKYPEHKDILEGVIKYRGLVKLLGTYAEKMPRIIKDKTGRVHTQLKQYGADTGRFSSEDPNLQNIPSKNKDIRPMFIASSGYYMISGDYSQQEPRALSFIANDEKMQSAYLNGKDMYAWVASDVYGVPYEECLEFHPETGEHQPEGDKRRSSMKSVVLGLIYGRQAKAISEQIGESKEYAQQIIDMFYDSFPQVKQYMDSRLDFTRENGWTKTVWGRKRRLPDLNLPDVSVLDLKTKEPLNDHLLVQQATQEMKSAGWKVSDKKEVENRWRKQGILVKDNSGFIADAERQVLNSEVQGTAADITKVAMLRISQNKRLREIGFRIIVPVHDEIIGEAPKEHAIEARDLLEKIMIEASAEKISVPMKVDTTISTGWYHEDLTSELEGK